ncbi:MAG TPA: hypothetical protein ACFYD3_10870 [Candidatus Hypogeohydataceae bacterium YC41]
MKQITNFKLPLSIYHPLPPPSEGGDKGEVSSRLQSVICNLKFLPCACLLDSVKDTPLYTNSLMLFIGGIFFLGALVAFLLAYKRGYIDFKGIEDVKYKVLEDREER